MDKTLQVQLQIRQNAEEISSALAEINKWEKQITHKDENLIKLKSKKSNESDHSSAIPVSKPSSSNINIRNGIGTVPVKYVESNVACVSNGQYYSPTR